MVKIKLLDTLYLLLWLTTGCKNEKKTAIISKRPNVLLIVADDLEFTDLGCYGSEINGLFGKIIQRLTF